MEEMGREGKGGEEKWGKGKQGEGKWKFTIKHQNCSNTRPLYA